MGMTPEEELAKQIDVNSQMFEKWKKFRPAERSMFSSTWYIAIIFPLK